MANDGADERFLERLHQGGLISAVFRRPLSSSNFALLRLIASAFAAAAAIATACAICSKNVVYLYVMMAIWAIGPPFWFLIEYTLARATVDADMNRLQHAQQLGAALWLGVFALLFAIASSPIVERWDHPKEASKGCLVPVVVLASPVSINFFQ